MKIVLSDITLCAILVSCGASFVAAAFWLQASRVPMPPFPDVGLDSVSSVFDPVRDALKTASRLNTRAAVFSGVAALAFGVALICGLISALLSTAAG
jgi:ABC-type antimicrobial peptide transport system permease subunit